MIPQADEMTEQSWQTCFHLQRMLSCLPERLSERKLRLFAVACCRHIGDLLFDARCWEAVTTAELFADDLATVADLSAAEVAACDYIAARERRFHFPWPVARSEDAEPIDRAAQAALACAWKSAAHAARASALQAAMAARIATIDRPRTLESALFCDLLRDILGNPFSVPPVLSPTCLTATVRAIGRTIYEERCFADLPILADALEEVGCGNTGVLEHCRGRGPHARGCWALDLVLQKS
jgi:hypothetical protein